MKLLKRQKYLLLIIFLTLVVDQASKMIVRAEIIGRTDNTHGEHVSLINDTFIMMNVENEGAFLGMGSNLGEPLRIILLLILPTLVLVFVFRHVYKDQSLDNWSVGAFSGIIGGGISNVADRIFRGSVTDFFFIDLGGFLKTGIFNMADVFVTTGMIMLLITSFKKKKINANL